MCEVGKYAFRNRWFAIAISSGQTAISANKNSAAGFEKSKPHCLYFEWQYAVRAIIQITFLRRHGSRLALHKQELSRSREDGSVH
jgi:hypothetical protein